MAQAKRRQKQRWPFIRKRVYPSGAIGWMVDSRTATGGERKSFETLSDAEVYAEQCRIRRKNEGDSAFDETKLARFGKTVQDAINFYVAHLEQNEASVPIREAVEKLLAYLKGQEHTDEYCYSVGLRLRRFCGDFGDRPASSVTAMDLNEWLVKLAAPPGTRNTFRRDLGTLFSFCLTNKYIKENPVLGTKAVKAVDKPAAILTPEEAKRVLDCAEPEVLAYTAIGMFAGIRKSELQKLDWRDVDLEEGIIEITAAKAKTARRRTIPIEPALRTYLEPIAKTSGPVAPVNLRRRLDASRRAAGFGTPGTETPAEKEAGVQLREWSSNAMRHTYASAWLAQHNDTDKLALQMGNSPAMVFKHYRQVVRPKTAAAFWAIRPS